MSGLRAEEAAVMFTEGVRAGVNACIKDAEEAMKRLDARGETMPAATLAVLVLRLQRHLPREKTDGR